jgi:signal transduction histidine kinase
MLHEFLEAHRTEVVELWRAKIARRITPRPTREQMEHGIPLFLGQLIEALRAQKHAIAAQEGPDTGVVGEGQRSAIAAAAGLHGRELLKHGFSVEQVVHDYGDLCQAVTEFAVLKRHQVTTEEFQVLNGCLDDAIADAVMGFGDQRDRLLSQKGDRAMGERLGSLAHEQRNFLNTAILSFAAIKAGAVGINGSTSAVLDRSLIGLRDLIDGALAEVRLAGGVSHPERIVLDRFVAELQVAACLEATAKNCEFQVMPIDARLAVHADKQLLNSATSNLLQNAFKFTRPNTRVVLRAYGRADRVMIEVEDQCGGLPHGKAEELFAPFEQRGADRSGVGLGLSISRRAVEASGGQLRVANNPGHGCVFTIEMPRAVEAGTSEDERALSRANTLL